MDSDALKRHLEVPLSTKEMCRPGCPLARKAGRWCATCPSRDARVLLWQRIRARSGSYIAMPAGDGSLLRRVLRGSIEVVDRRSDPPMRSGLKWTGRLRDGSPDARGKPTADQRRLLREWLRHVRAETGGIVVSPPRSGKTALGVASGLATRSRTFITAHKIDLLRQFGRRFATLTNLRELYERGRRPVVLVDPRGWPDGAECGVHVLKTWGPDVDRADVVMSCYHQFLGSRGRERMRRYVDGKFGTMVGDEIHLASAPGFSLVMNRINARRRLGLTATPHRGDGLMPVATAVMGRVAVIGRITADLPRLELLETGIGSGRHHASFNGVVSFLTGSQERNRVILRQVFRDLRENKKNCVLLPTTRRQHIHDLVKMINAQADYCRRERGEDWPTELAVSYYGKSDTNAILKQVGEGRARVVVAMMSMIQYGLDVERWTHVYVGVTPTSSAYNVFQALNRVCTPYSPETQARLGSKPQAVVRFVIDEVSASIFCFVKLYADKDYGIKRGLSGDNYYRVRLCTASREVAARMDVIAKFPKSYSATDVGVELRLGKTRSGKRRKKSAWRPMREGITRF